MTGSIQQAEIELAAYVEQLRDIKRAKHQAQFAAQAEYEKAADVLRSAECSLQFLQQFREQMRECEVLVYFTPPTANQNDMTQTDASKAGGAS